MSLSQHAKQSLHKRLYGFLSLTKNVAPVARILGVTPQGLARSPALLAPVSAYKMSMTAFWLK